MQKKIIALAIAGLVSGGAFAQSTVTISGLVRMSGEQYKLSSTPAGTDASAENRISDQSSMLVFTSREDLGGGMYAGFVLDNRFAPDVTGVSGATGQTSNTLAGGNSNINIGGNWGQVAMGRQDLHYGSAIESYKAYTLQNILSNGLFAQMPTGATIANGTRTPNVIMYNSPNMSGFTGRLAVSTSWNAAAAAPGANEGSGLRASGANDPGKGSATNVELKYVNGPIIAGYSYWRATVEGGKTATAGDQRGDTLQFAWTFPMGVKLGIAANQSRQEFTGGDFKRTAWLLPISYDFGSNQVAFTYAKANNASGSGCGGGCNDTGANAYTLSFGHSLSKRTNVGVAYTKLDNKSNASYDMFALSANGATGTPTGADASQLSLNMNHSF